MAINPNTNFTAGAVLTAAQQNRFPRGVMGRATATALQVINSGNYADVTNLTATFTAVANRYYKISFAFPSCSGDSGNRLNVVVANSSNTVYSTFYLSVVSTGLPLSGFTTQTFAAGSVTLKMRAVRDTGAGAINLYGAADAPMEFLIEDIGPA